MKNIKQQTPAHNTKLNNNKRRPENKDHIDSCEGDEEQLELIIKGKKFKKVTDDKDNKVSNIKKLISEFLADHKTIKSTVQYSYAHPTERGIKNICSVTRRVHQVYMCYFNSLCQC